MMNDNGSAPTARVRVQRFNPDVDKKPYLQEFKVPWCRLTLNKQGAVRGVRDVGVIIERSQSG